MYANLNLSLHISIKLNIYVKAAAKGKIDANNTMYPY